MNRFLTEADASTTWVRQAARDARIDAITFNSIMDLRFGDKRVTQDPSDPESNLIAASKGHVVVGAAALSSEEAKTHHVTRLVTSTQRGHATGTAG